MLRFVFFFHCSLSAFYVNFCVSKQLLTFDFRGFTCFVLIFLFCPNSTIFVQLAKVYNFGFSLSNIIGISLSSNGTYYSFISCCFFVHWEFGNVMFASGILSEYQIRYSYVYYSFFSLPVINFAAQDSL